MSRQFLTPINMTGNSILNMAPQPQTGAPSSPFLGQTYFDTALFELLSWNGTAWVNNATNSLLLQGLNSAYLLARANATGTQLAATISNFAAAANALTLDTFAAPVAAVSMNGQRLTNVAAPTASTDAANKSYVDISVQGLTAKPSARAATTGPLPTNVYANGTAGTGATLTASAVGALTIDTYAVALGDNILVKNEATAANNGLYSVTTLGTASVAYILTRSTAMQTATEFGGAFLPVENLGAANANSLWVCNVANSITVGTTAVVFTQLNGATDLLQGNGISISGNTVSFLPNPAANTGLQVTASGASINFGGTYSWTGANTFSAALTASLGLTVSGAAFTSRGITDNATATALTLTAGAQIGAPTGGDKGAGTINATGYFLNGTALANGVSANPTASLGLTAINGVATTFMRSDGAPALSQAIAPVWTGNHTFSSVNGVTITAATAPSAFSLTVTGPSANAAISAISGASATTATADLLVTRAGSTANNVVQGANLTLADSTNNTYSCLQQSGGQTELWQNNGTWKQILKVATTGGIVVSAPTSGQALTVTGFAGSSALQLLTTGMQVGAPTGGELGAGKINVAGGFYVNGVGVTANSPGKYSQAFGDGSTLSYTITHNLNTQDLVASVYSATTPFAEIDCDISHTTVNTATLAFATAPTAGQFRVVLHG